MPQLSPKKRRAPSAVAPSRKPPSKAALFCSRSLEIRLTGVTFSNVKTLSMRL